MAATSYGEFLARKSQVANMAGFEPEFLPDFLFDFQRYLVEWAVRKGRAAIFADCGLGKGFLRDQPILTPYGFQPLASLSVGDRVIGANGRPTEILGVYPRGVQPLFKLTFSDGVVVVCDGDHLWNVKSYNDVARGKEWRTINTAELSQTQLKYGTHGQSRTWQIPLVAPVEFATKELPLDPYILGVLLGDGTINGSVSWCKNDPEIADRVRSALPAGVSVVRSDINDRASKWSIVGDDGCKNSVMAACRELELEGKRSWEKFIPPAYMLSDVAQRLSLLQGLMDTDGYSGESPEFCSTSVDLATGVRQLVESLGGTASMAIKESPQYEYKGELKTGRTAYRVVLSMPPGINPFWLPRKAMEFKSPSRGVGRWIDSIESHGHGETTCIKVAADDGLFVIDRHVVTHNTPMMLSWADAIVRKTNKPALIVAPLGVSHQIVSDGEKFGIEAHRSIDGKSKSHITVTNYERLDKFDPDDYSAVCCDESQIIRHWSGATQKAVTRFLSKKQYRLLCSATPAPNDYIELGTASEALGDLPYSDMLATFFRQVSDDEKKKRATASDIISSKRLSWRVIQSFGQWTMRAHAFEPFWKWVSTWSRACRKPSDLGDFDDARFVLPPLNRRDHIVTPRTPPAGFLFTIPAIGLQQERAERRRTLAERSELAAELCDKSDSCVVWCNLNPEGDALEKTIPGAVQVSGSQSIDKKEELILAFLNGEARVLVTKAKIAGLGLNMQHCAHVITFVDHSYEKFYQSVRRCWRFGQKRPVTLDVIATEGEVNVKKNIERKEQIASQMFDAVVRFMNEAQTVTVAGRNIKEEVPSWLCASN